MNTMDAPFVPMQMERGGAYQDIAYHVDVGEGRVRLRIVKVSRRGPCGAERVCVDGKQAEPEISTPEGDDENTRIGGQRASIHHSDM